MKKLLLASLVLVAGVVSQARANDLIVTPMVAPTVVHSPVIAYSPVVQSVPAQTVYSPVVSPAPVVAYSPVVAPQPVVTYSPVVAPQPVVTYSPVVAPAVPVTAYYAPPAYTVGRPVVVRQTYYVPGQPIRNLFRALAP